VFDKINDLADRMVLAEVVTDDTYHWAGLRLFTLLLWNEHRSTG
jgi:hypothetical protein